MAPDRARILFSLRQLLTKRVLFVTRRAMQERRRTQDASIKGADLPTDFAQMVKELLENHLEAPLQWIEKETGKASVQVSGALFPDEILLTLTLAYGDSVKATSFHVSVDFDPYADRPTAEDLLKDCVDGLGELAAEYLDVSKPELLEKFIAGSLSAYEEAPFQWTSLTLQSNKRSLFVKIDKVNPALEKMTEDWLQENDPEWKEASEAEHSSDAEFLEDRVEQLKKNRNQ